MATEAQRLMVMSLGKIQGCRQQRGGINLYKSLLVTKVLYRARSVALSENAVQKKEPSDDQCVPEMNVPEDDHVDSVDNDGDSEWDNNTSTCTPDKEYSSDNFADTQDKENVKPQDICNKPKNYPVHSPEDFADQKSIKDQSIDRCSRCVKRRLTEVEEAVESISPKKQRIEESEQSLYGPEPMQVETTQISTLVNRFSSGFTGLLASETDNNTPVCQETHDIHDSQGHTDSSLLSCSTQIKESFELLARPIALSV